MNMSESSHGGDGVAAESGTVANGVDESSVSEATVVVDRGRHVDGGDDDDAERTVVVDRSSSEATGADNDDDDDNERTVVVDRDDNERTVAVDRKGSGSDSTVVVGKRAKSKTPASRGPRGRQRINLPPVEPGFAEKAVLASGPGAVESYPARQLPAQPLPSAHVEHDSLVTRPPADVVPSVRKASRRYGIIAVVGFAIACVISVVGLVAIVVGVLRSL